MRIAAIAAAALVGTAQASSLDIVAATTPSGAADGAPGASWFSAAGDGVRRIFRDGHTDLYLSGYAWHMPYEYSSERRDEQNHNAWGGGIGRTLTDGKDNERLLYVMATRDSNYLPQYMAGYAWMANWRAVGDFRVGAGYTAFLIARSDYGNYFPVPALLPLASVGTRRVSLFGTYIPFSDVAFFFARVSFH